ncbi:NAD(P)/FAD-dependent oxidoreductase [Nostoc favosum]|uniref:FAD-dependent oxidoreductase n=1 Tax=Nostoc favosum CHAB5714 TaxID=2780399 RepID=A0ABS8IDF3_9NOSO|nr:FAD-dependent oxidoreductase [Nostoc favosum]MCC5602118.1 FAD-dependent oxidoreductase [Nostoc favosum CHAB5714]
MTNLYSKVRVVVVGGGLAGHKIAFHLQNKAQVTLIDPKDFFEIPMAVPRLFVEPSRAKDAVIPYTEFLPQVTHIQGKAVNATPAYVVVESIKGDNAIVKVEYDYLVLATGSNYFDDSVKAHLGTTEQRRNYFFSVNEQLTIAQKILIVGGGPVGVEIAGEIVEDYPGKQVTLVQKTPYLLPDTSKKPQEDAAQFLQNKGVRLIFEEKVVHTDCDETAKTKVAITDQGTQIEYNMLFWCTGATSDTSYIKEYFKDALDEAGRVRVNENLSVVGYDNIFAVGDIIALPENKLGLLADKHATVVIKNLEKLLMNPSIQPSKLKKYKPAIGSQVMIVTLGRNHGVGHFPFEIFGSNWIAKIIKSKDMLVSMYRKGINLK